MSAPHRMSRRRFPTAGWFARLVARTDIQALISKLPVLRVMARREGEEIFDILQGFVASQVLQALIELNILRDLLDGPGDARCFAPRAGVPEARMEQLLRAGVALGLLRRARKRGYRLSRRGAALLGVPGLEAMIRHNRVLYADLSDPVAIMRGESETELQRFWPYVLGAADGMPGGVAGEYSDLMAQSQVLVAQDTLRMVPMKGITRLLDVGGGAGVFVGHVLRRYPAMAGMIFDLPEVVATARANLARSGSADRVAVYPGSFRDQALPEGADAISLIRILYDHGDHTVAALMARVYDALPPGGRLIISEPMSGGDTPDRFGDVYFAFYTMAMGTGKVRSPQELAGICRAAGFDEIRVPRAPRPFITSALTCVKPAVAGREKV